MPVVTFVKEKKQIQVPEGANLRTEAMKHGVSVYKGIHKIAHCPGIGGCMTCRVRIVKGAQNASPMGWFEKLRWRMSQFLPIFGDPLAGFAYLGNEDTMRLACKTKVQGDMEVETTPGVNLYGDNFFS